MSIAPIVQDGDPVLRGQAKPVAPQEFGTAELLGVIDTMIVTLAREIDGVAIAAPQIGIDKQIFVVAGAVLRETHTKYADEPDYTVYINPTILKLSRETRVLDEGCLSVRRVYGKVPRSARAKVRAYTTQGQVFERGASGLLAQIFQHEVDHLHGILFVDKAIETETLTEQEMLEMQEHAREKRNKK